MEDFKLGTDLCTFPASRPWTVSSSIFLLTSFIHSASRCRRPSSWHSGCGAGSLLLLTTLLSPYVPGILQFLNNSPSSLIGLILLNSRMHQQPEMDLPRYIVLDLTAQTTGLGETLAKTLPHMSSSLWYCVSYLMKQKYKQAVSELSHTQESQIVTTPTQPQLNLSLGWQQNSDRWMGIFLPHPPYKNINKLCLSCPILRRDFALRSNQYCHNPNSTTTQLNLT